VFSTLVGNLTLLLTQNVTTANGTSKQLSPQFDVNNDTFVSIDDELKPRLIDQFRSLSVVTPGMKVSPVEGPIWVKSQYALQPNLSIIGNVSNSTSILMLNGENDSETPVQQPFLLQQRLTEVNHPDHTLITYPNLGHIFYPSPQWFMGDGPVEPYVLADLYSWLEAHSGLSNPYLAPAFSNMTSKSTDTGSNSSSSESQ
jgi:hypothetical protein